jgi:hypothetical protein
VKSSHFGRLPQVMTSRIILFDLMMEVPTQ